MKKMYLKKYYMSIMYNKNIFRNMSPDNKIYLFHSK